MTTDRTNVVVLCGGDHDAQRVPDVPDGAFVIAADSGLHLAARFGRSVDLVVGDLDSVDPDALAASRADGAVIEEHPTAKDATDLELALATALERGASNVTVVGGAGGRFDHLLGNVSVFASPAYAAMAIEAYIGPARLQVTHGRTVEITGATGSLVSLLPMWGPARGITTTGLHYPLRDEDLAPGTSRGISNVISEHPATVALAAGTLLIVEPDGGLA